MTGFAFECLQQLTDRSGCSHGFAARAHATHMLVFECKLPWECGCI